MTPTTICVLGLFALLAFGRLVSEIGSVMRARAYGRGGPCPCSAVTSISVSDASPGRFVPLVPGTEITLPPGTVILGEDAARKVH